MVINLLSWVEGTEPFWLSSFPSCLQGALVSLALALGLAEKVWSLTQLPGFQCSLSQRAKANSRVHYEKNHLDTRPRSILSHPT